MKRGANQRPYRAEAITAVARIKAADLLFACVSCGRRYPDHDRKCKALMRLCLEPAPEGSGAGVSPCISRRHHRGAHVYGTPWERDFE